MLVLIGRTHNINIDLLSGGSAEYCSITHQPQRINEPPLPPLPPPPPLNPPPKEGEVMGGGESHRPEGGAVNNREELSLSPVLGVLSCLTARGQQSLRLTARGQQSRCDLQLHRGQP